MRHEAGEHAPWMKPILRRLQRGAHLRRIVRVVVDQGDAAHLAAHLESPADPLEPADGIHGGGYRHADPDAGGERR